MWKLWRFKIDESLNESTGKGNKENIKKKNNFVKKLVPIYARKDLIIMELIFCMRQLIET